jgi:peroxiredoxin
VKRYAGVGVLGLLILAAAGCAEPNKPPIASFTRSPASGVAPLAVFFDATESSDADGVVSSYEWDFGDGAVAAGTTATHTYLRAGMYSATLTVTDDLGKATSAMRAVDVSASGAPPPTGTGIGDRAPDILLADIGTGEVRSLSSFRGYVVLLEFWRSTCSACRTSMPVIEALRARFSTAGLLVVLVSEDVTAEEARNALEEQGYEGFICLFDAAGAARSLYDVDVVPRAFIIDRQGIVRHEDHPARVRDRDITPWL